MYNNNGGFRQKRQRSPDYEDNNRGLFRGGYHTAHGPYKKHRGERNFQHIQPKTFEEKISNLGDAGTSSMHIGMLAEEISGYLTNVKEKNDNNYPGEVNTLVIRICKCIVSFPTRVATYTTLISLIASKHYNVSLQIMNTLRVSYPLYLEAQKWQEALNIIHFLSSLVNCNLISPLSLLSQFELFLKTTTEDNVPQTRSDYYVYTVLSSLPHVVFKQQKLDDDGDDDEKKTKVEDVLDVKDVPETLERILSTIQTYLIKRSKNHLNVTRVWLSDDSTIQMDYLDSLWVQTKNFKSNNWQETFINRPYNDKPYKDCKSNSIPSKLEEIQIPAHSPAYQYPCPRIVLRLFEDDVTEKQFSIPGSDKIERFCIENHIRNIIDEYSSEPVRACARHLIHVYHSDKLPWKHLLIETLLGELFTLPKPKHQEILYHSLLFELTKFYPSKNPDELLKHKYEVILNEAVKVLYDNLDTMNITCVDRFIDWFSFHLNNIDFVFPWQNWADATCKEKTSLKVLFVQNILDHCVRFSFDKKINSLIGEHLASLMPAVVGTKYQPVFAENPKVQELDATIEKLIAEKADGKTISETLNIEIDGVEMPEDFIFKEEKLSDKLLKIDIFTTVILTKASRSLTHLSSAFGKYKNVLKALTRVEGGQVQLLQTMHSCLESHPQLQVILVDKLLKAELLEPKEVCNWLFSESMKLFHIKSYPWELLNNTIHRTLQNEKNLIDEKAEPVEEVKEVKEEKNEDDDGDVVMESEDRTVLDAKIVKAKNQSQELILQVFGMFAEILGDHIRKCEVSNASYMDDWFRLITGRMQQVYYKHYSVTSSLYDELKTIIDRTPSIGNSIINFI